MIKDKDPRRKETAYLNWGKFLYRKIWMQLHQKGSMRHNNFPNWGKIFLSKNFGEGMLQFLVVKLGQIFLTKNLIQKKMATIEAFKLGQSFLTKNLPSHSTEQEKNSENVFRW